jgi:hypothetical protein
LETRIGLLSELWCKNVNVEKVGKLKYIFKKTGWEGKDWIYSAQDKKNCGLF